MGRFYGALKAGRGKLEALHGAQLELLRQRRAAGGAATRTTGPASSWSATLNSEDVGRGTVEVCGRGRPLIRFPAISCAP